MDDEGNIVPARDFKPVGLRVLMNWILNLKEEFTPKKTEPQKKNVVTKSSTNNSRPSAPKTVHINANSNNTNSKEIVLTDDEPDEVNIVSYIIALIVSGMKALACFVSGHWIIGIVQTLLFFMTLGVRRDKEWHQGAGRWFWYALLLFVGGGMGCDGRWWGALIVDFICIGIIYKGK
jgi:hypothetical protein